MFSELNPGLLQELQRSGEVDSDSLMMDMERVACYVASILKRSFGPRGKLKLVVSPSGDVYLTRKGKKIIEECNFVHPVSVVLKGLAKALDKECRDGVKTAIIVCCKLIENGVKLIRNGIHPKTVISGYQQALRKSYEILEYVSRMVTEDTDTQLVKVAISELKNGEIDEQKALELSKQVVRNVEKILFKNKSLMINELDLNKIRTVKVRGCGGVEFVDGLLINERPARIDCPKLVKNSFVAILNSKLNVKTSRSNLREYLGKYPFIVDSEFTEKHRNWRRDKLYRLYRKIIETGANTIVCGGDVDPYLEFLLTKKNVYVLKKVKKKDLELISQVTGSKITVIDDLKPESLGFAEETRMVRIGDEYMTHFRGCKHETTTLLIKSPSGKVVDRIEEIVNNAINAVGYTSIYKKVIPGGGAVEAEIVLALKEYASTLSGRISLAVDAAGDSLKEVPKTLAENSGSDPLELLSGLMGAHKRGKIHAHINAKGKLQIDENGMFEPLEPFYVKSKVLISAFEAACLVLGVDALLLMK
jgi:chaperonin GroEL (HSP60 family)